MSYSVVVKRGDLAPDVEITVTDETGAPVDLTGATITFSMASSRRPAVLLLDDVAGEIVNALQGKIAYRWSTGQTDIEAGTYEGEFTIAPSGIGDAMQAPTVGKILIYIEARVGDV